MAKKSVEVNKAILIKAIETAERKGPLANLGELWNAVTLLYNGGKLGEIEAQITHSVASLRAKAWDIPIKTQPGKRGGGGDGLAAWREKNAGKKTKRTPKAEKFKGDKAVQIGFKRLRKEMQAIPEARRYLKLVDDCASGKRAQAVKLKCLDCSNWQSREVGSCVVKSCPLYAFRPYQKQLVKEEVEK